jgi:molybdate transport system substrate-binding protein
VGTDRQDLGREAGSVTATLHLLCAGAAKGLVEALHPDFEARHGVRFESAFGAVGAMRDRLLAGGPCDVIVLTAKMIEGLARTGAVTGDSPRGLGNVYTGLAVPSGQATFDPTSTDTLRKALAGARGIYLPDPERATAGIHFVKVLERLGILGDVRDRLRPHPSGAVAMRAMADAGTAGETALVGCTQVTEIRYTNGVQLAGLLPREFELSTLYTAAVCTRASDPPTAEAFVELLGGEATTALRRAGGFVVD